MSMNTMVRAGEPMYMVIAADLKDKIIAGEWRPGDTLPSENELRGLFAASRETVRKSLKELENEGYIYSRAGKGYFVCKPEYGRFTLELKEDTQATLRHITVTTPRAEVAQALGLEKKKKVIEIVRISHPNGQIAACELRYLPYDQGQPTIESDINYAVFPEVAAGKTSAFAFHTEMAISAECAAGKVAEYLSCEVGTPLLVLRRYLVSRGGKNLGYAIKYVLPGCGPLTASTAAER